MSHRHATSAELELYVLGGLDPERAAMVEEHCATCDTCARALAGEARLEVAFEQVARRAEHAPIIARPRGDEAGPVVGGLRAAAYGAAGLVAMAAAVLLWFGRAAATATTGEGTAAAAHHSMQDGAILDAKNDALDGG
jgi:anti-sigma factor RsiW